LDRESARGGSRNLNFHCRRCLRETFKNACQISGRQLLSDAKSDDTRDWNCLHRPQDVIVERQKLPRPPEQIVSFLIEFDAAALAANQYRFPQNALKPLYLK
jgi:hypothetical protein